MATISLNPKKNGGETKDFVVLPSDVYRMKILKASVEENRFAEPEKDGTRPSQLVLTWEITTLTDEQREAAEEAGEAWDKAQVWQRMNPYYGPVRNGGDSKFKAFIDSLREQGHFSDVDADGDIDTEQLVNIEQRVNVERYIKGQGENAGKPGNKVVSVLPLKRANGKKKAAVEVEELPF